MEEGSLEVLQDLLEADLVRFGAMRGHVKAIGEGHSPPCRCFARAASGAHRVAGKHGKAMHRAGTIF
jgi:hypothetical protein